MRSRWMSWGLVAVAALMAAGCRANLGNLFDLY